MATVTYCHDKFSDDNARKKNSHLPSDLFSRKYLVTIMLSSPVPCTHEKFGDDNVRENKAQHQINQPGIIISVIKLLRWVYGWLRKRF